MNDRNKLLVSVMLPATRKTYDFWVPSDMSIRDAGQLIASILETRERDRFSATPGNALMSGETGNLIDPRCTVGEAGLVNGSRLVLV